MSWECRSPSGKVRALPVWHLCSVLHTWHGSTHLKSHHWRGLGSSGHPQPHQQSEASLQSWCEALSQNGLRKIRHMACVYMMLCNILDCSTSAWYCVRLQTLILLISIYTTLSEFTLPFYWWTCRNFTSIPLLLKLLYIIIIYIYYDTWT